MNIQRLRTAIRYRVSLVTDFLVYRKRMRQIMKDLRPGASQDRGAFLLVSGRGMNVVWAQLWPIFSLPLLLKGMRGKVLTTPQQRLLNGYYGLVGFDLLTIEDYYTRDGLSADLDTAIEALVTFEDFHNFEYNGAPVGQIALSTYSRHFGTGDIDLSKPDVLAYVRKWARMVCATMIAAAELFQQQNIKTLFFTEVFMEEYGAFYYAALHARLNVVRFAGTVRDDAFILQHLSMDNDRIHHSSIDSSTWAQIAKAADDEKIDREFFENFDDRYSTKWHRSRRNQVSEETVDIAEMRQALGVAPDRKVAVIYSHILYDTLFFFGTDLYADYAEWLVKTTQAAIRNPHIDWLVKIHPSNLWRGELGSLLKGQFEEERLIAREIGALPAHVRLVPPDTPYNPYNWFRMADYGITVRGTSGLEMAALGKTVVTAGTGRYEGNGFTLDPATRDEYENLLMRLHEVPDPTPAQVTLARRYAHAIFVRKPFTLSSADVRLRSGVTTLRSSDDLAYFPKPGLGKRLSPDLERFGDWALNASDRDLLS